MRRTGILSISSSGISRLGFKRLMKGALDNDGFRRATDFLEQDRNLNPGETIWVDGTDAPFAGDSVILITNAGRPTQTAAAKRGAAAATTAAASAERSSDGRKAMKKSGAKKSAAKKSAAKGAKKSGGGRKSAKRSAKKSTK